MSNFLGILLIIAFCIFGILMNMSAERQYQICYDKDDIAFYIGLNKLDPLVAPKGSSCKSVLITKERAIQIRHQIKSK